MHDINKMNRRTFLKTASYSAALLSLFPGRTLAQIEPKCNVNQAEDLEKYDFILPRVKFTPKRVPGRGQGPDKWYIRPGGDACLLMRLSSVIRCNPKPIPRAYGWEPEWAADNQFNDIVTFDESEKINKYPFLFMTGENEFEFTSTQKNNLREYIKRGGFLFMDDCVVDNGGDFFYQSAYSLLEEVFGRDSVKSIPREHEVFHNVYDLGSIGLPYMKGYNHGARGIFTGDRIGVFLSSNDIHCGWCDTLCESFGPMGHELAIQMGINIIMYAISH